jgi:hypothetical protein
MRVALLLSTLAMALVSQASSLTGERALVLLDSLDDGASYKELWKDLEGNEANLTGAQEDAPEMPSDHRTRS